MALSKTAIIFRIHSVWRTKNMSIRHLSTPAIHGLCAASFLGASLHVVEYFLSTIFSWQVNHFSPSLLLWASWTVVALLLSFVCALVGMRLLYRRAHSVLHSLVLGWMILLACTAQAVMWAHSFGHAQHLPPLGYWLPFLVESAISIFVAAIVVWLLGELRLREGRDYPVVHR